MKATPTEAAKVALDEGRMLILVVEVLIGFAYQSVFQPGFEHLATLSRDVSFLAFVLLLVTLGLLMMVPAHHRLVEEGRNTRRFFRFATLIMGVVLLPFAIVLAMEVFVVAEKTAGNLIAICISSGVLLIALTGWFLIPALRAWTAKTKTNFPMNEEIPPLKDRINLVLTECRVVLPGTQALLGFQMIAFFTNGFEKLTHGQQITHLSALIAILVSAILLMLPAAYHRVGESGNNSEHLFRVSNFCLMAALFALALGISLDFYVVAKKILSDKSEAVFGASSTFIFFIALWYLIPLGRRKRVKRI